MWIDILPLWAAHSQLALKWKWISPFLANDVVCITEVIRFLCRMQINVLNGKRIKAQHLNIAQTCCSYFYASENLKEKLELKRNVLPKVYIII